VTLADVPGSWLADLRGNGVDIVYVLGVWQTGAAGLAVSQQRVTPPELAVSSPFAITDYSVHTALGGDAALRTLKARANAYGLRVLVDFVPNHVARDHKCVGHAWCSPECDGGADPRQPCGATGMARLSTS
jgi:glycosidase